MVGLVRARSHVGAWAMTAVGLLSLAAAFAAPRVRLDTVPVGVPRAGADITPWAGTFLLPLALVLVGAAVYGVAEAPLRRSTGGWAALARWPVVAGLVLAGVGGLAVAGWATLGTSLHPWTDPRLEAGIDQATSDPAGRTLFVTVGTDGAAYRIVGRETDGPVRTLPTLGADEGQVAPAVSGILDGSPGAWDTALADRAIGLIGLHDGAPADLPRRLDSTDGLTRLGQRDGWSYWRVRAAGTGDNRPATPPRLRLDDPDRSAMVPTHGQNAATTTRVTAAPGRDPRRRRAARLGRARHRARSTVASSRVEDGEGSPTYAVPAGSGTLVVDVDSGPTWWRVAQVVLLVALVFLAIPFGRRESRGRG